MGPVIFEFEFISQYMSPQLLFGITVIKHTQLPVVRTRHMYMLKLIHVATEKNHSDIATNYNSHYSIHTADFPTTSRKKKTTTTTNQPTMTTTTDDEMTRSTSTAASTSTMMDSGKLAWTRLNYKGPLLHDNRRLLKHRAKNCECHVCTRELKKLPPMETHAEYIASCKFEEREIKRAKKRAKKEVKDGKQKTIRSFFKTTGSP